MIADSIIDLHEALALCSRNHGIVNHLITELKRVFVLYKKNKL